MLDGFLKEITLFRGLDAEALRELQFVSVPFVLASGKALFVQGDEADGMYLLKSGVVSVARRLPGDESIELASLGRGSVIGEMGLLDRGRRSATATAVEDCAGYFISFARFEHLRLGCTGAAFGVMMCFVGEVVQRLRGLLREAEALIDESPEIAPGLRVSDVPHAHGAREDSGPLPRWEVLAQIPFLRRLTENELKSFVESMRALSVPRGALLFEQGADPEHCHVVIRGAVALSMVHEDRYVQVAILGPGSVVGEIALIDGMPQPFECIAREDTLLMTMHRSGFESLRRDRSPTAFKFFEAVTGDAVGLLRKINGHIAWMRPERQFRAEVSSSNHASDDRGYR